jgi:hypothetical protein
MLGVTVVVGGHADPLGLRGVPVYQLVLAMVLTAGTALLLVMAGSSIYRRALLITGRRVTLREVLRGS